MVEWQINHRLFEAVFSERTGTSPSAAAQAVIDGTRPLPRSAWGIGDGTYYMDAEAFVLLGKPALAMQALEEILLKDGGFIPFDSFSLPADRGLVLSALDGNPDFEDWKTRFRERRAAMRERLLEMEAAGEIPMPPDKPK
jgi:hypothetical protein